MKRFEELRMAAVEEMRKTVREQVATWRLVPNLALEADGSVGFSDRYRMAYTYGYWDVNGRMSVFVDLLTGELVSDFGVLGGNPPQPAGDSAIMDFSAELLDAERVVRELRQEAKPHRRYNHLDQDVISWRDGIRAQLGGLGQVYRPENRRGYPHFSIID